MCRVYTVYIRYIYIYAHTHTFNKYLVVSNIRNKYMRMCAYCICNTQISFNCLIDTTLIKYTHINVGMGRELRFYNTCFQIGLLVE